MGDQKLQDGGADSADDKQNAGGTAGSAEGDPSGSLKSEDLKKSPREAFLEEHTLDEASRNTRSRESDEDDEDDDEDVDDSGSEAEDDEDDESSSDKSTDEDDDEGDEEPDEKGEGDGDEEDDEDEPELGVDLSDIEGIDEGDGEDEIPQDFNPKKDLPKKVWKRLPKEAQQAFINHQRLNKRLLKQQKQNEPLVGYTRELLRSAEQAQVKPQTLNAWIDVGLRAQQGDPEAIEAVGNIALKGGFQPSGAARSEPNLEKLQSLLRQKVDDLDLAPEVAKEILTAAKPEAPAPSENGQQAQQQPQQTEPRGRVMRRAPETAPGEDLHTQEAQQAALQNIGEINKRFAKRFGRKWPELQERVRREVVLEQASNPRSNPKAWVKLWADTAEKVVKKHLKQSKSRKKKRLQGDSDSLGRGEPVSGRAGGKKTDNPRERFLREHAS